MTGGIMKRFAISTSLFSVAALLLFAGAAQARSCTGQVGTFQIDSHLVKYGTCQVPINEEGFLSFTNGGKTVELATEFQLGPPGANIKEIAAGSWASQAAVPAGTTSICVGIDGSEVSGTDDDPKVELLIKYKGGKVREHAELSEGSETFCGSIPVGAKAISWQFIFEAIGAKNKVGAATIALESVTYA
jgi:hypothetical protein